MVDSFFRCHPSAGGADTTDTADANTVRHTDNVSLVHTLPQDARLGNIFGSLIIFGVSKFWDFKEFF